MIIVHYRNGREAKNGDKIVKLGADDGKIVAFGVLHSATADGGDYCNGGIAPIVSDHGACMVDCLHVDDLALLLKGKGLNKRPTSQ